MLFFLLTKKSIYCKRFIHSVKNGFIMEKYRNLKKKDNKILKISDGFLQGLIEDKTAINAGNNSLNPTGEVFKKEFKAILKEIVNERDKYFELFDNGPAGYVVLDASYRINEINETGRNLLKIEEAELLGRPFSDFVASEFIESFGFFLKNLKAGKNDRDCWLKIKNESKNVVVKGITGGEDIAEKQSIRLVFFHSSGLLKDSLSFNEAEESNTDQSSGNSNEFPVNPATIEEILGKLSILVVDDDEVARIYLDEILKNKCRKILFANNGKDAVEVFQTNPAIDLILMDIKMPVMDGYTATIKIKGHNKNVIVIAQTAYALASDREKALAAGCNDYLAKPLMKKDLFSVIEKFFK